MSGKCVFRKWWEVGFGGRVGEALVSAGFNQGLRQGRKSSTTGFRFYARGWESSWEAAWTLRCAVMGWGQQGREEMGHVRKNLW